MFPLQPLPRQVIGIYGEAGSYSHAAACMLLSSDRIRFLNDFDDALQALEDGHIDLAVLPLENSSAGSVLAVLDGLVRHPNLSIIAETALPIHHVLALSPGSRAEGITTVISHEQALRQTRHYWRSKGWQSRLASSTAAAARTLAASGQSREAAICSAFAADIYGLDIVDRNIQDAESNTTRFVLLADRKAPPVHKLPADKGAYTFMLPHRSGALLKVLQAFADARVNLVKLESRPLPQKPFEYRFFVDVDLHTGNPAQALADCRPLWTNALCLGEYPVLKTCSKIK